MAQVNMTVNGKPVSVRGIEGRTLLSDILREGLGPADRHPCGLRYQPVRGLRHVHVDGAAIKSCTMFAAEAARRRCHDD